MLWAAELQKYIYNILCCVVLCCVVQCVCLRVCVCVLYYLILYWENRYFFCIVQNSSHSLAIPYTFCFSLTSNHRHAKLSDALFDAFTLATLKEIRFYYRFNVLLIAFVSVSALFNAHRCKFTLRFHIQAFNSIHTKSCTHTQSLTRTHTQWANGSPVMCFRTMCACSVTDWIRYSSWHCVRIL